MITMMPVQPPVPPSPRSPQQRRAGQAGDLLPLGDWIRHHSLRSWPVALFLLLICVPTIALVILGPSPSASTFDHVAWIFAAYFAVAWLLLLGVIIRPEHVTRPMLVLVTVIALATQVPLAVTLEVDLHAETAGLGPSIWSVGLPEELAKAIPVLAVAVVYRLGGRHELTPKDYLVPRRGQRPGVRGQRGGALLHGQRPGGVLPDRAVGPPLAPLRVAPGAKSG
jgi:hypothetical protein